MVCDSCDNPHIEAIHTQDVVQPRQDNEGDGVSTILRASRAVREEIREGEQQECPCEYHGLPSLPDTSDVHESEYNGRSAEDDDGLESKIKNFKHSSILSSVEGPSKADTACIRSEVFHAPTVGQSKVNGQRLTPARRKHTIPIRAVFHRTALVEEAV